VKNDDAINQAKIEADLASMVRGSPAPTTPAEATPHSAAATKYAPLVPMSEYERYLQQIERLMAEYANFHKQGEDAHAAARDAHRSGRVSEARRFETEELRVMALARTRRDDIERVRYRASQTVEAFRGQRSHVPQTPEAG